MRCREFITLLGGAAAGWPLAAGAQQGFRPRQVGLLMGLDERDPEAKARFIAFDQALRTRGWTNGDIRVVTRWAAASSETTRTYASELIGLRPDVIVVNTPIGLAALHAGTNQIPIVFVQVFDAAEGTVGSTARPGGNITGFYAFFEYANTLWRGSGCNCSGSSRQGRGASR